MKIFIPLIAGFSVPGLYLFYKWLTHRQPQHELCHHSWVVRSVRVCETTNLIRRCPWCATEESGFSTKLTDRC